MFRVRTALTGGAGGPQVNTLYFSSFPGRTAEAASAAAGLFWTTVAPVMSGEYSFATEADVYTLTDSTGTITGVTTTTVVDGAGTASGDPLPWMTQGLVRFNTGLYVGGRLVKGRAFIPGATEGFSTGGVPDSTYNDVLDYAGALLLAADNAELFVWSQKNGDTWPVISASHGTMWSYLSSRRS
jgi:hypothetical protein